MLFAINSEPDAFPWFFIFRFQPLAFGSVSKVPKLQIIYGLSSRPLVGNEGMNPKYTNVKVDSLIPYQKPASYYALVSLNNALLNPYFFGGGYVREG